MKKSILSLLAVLAIFTGCSRSDPGPLAGTWRMAGLIPMTVQFRPGEAETMGLIEKVSYEVRGNEVIVRYETGPMQGTAVRFTMTGPNSARSGLGVLRGIN
jgi:hypothetical protein